MPEKIILQKYLKIRKGTKNVRIPYIFRTLSILHFFVTLKFFWDFIWFWFCLNVFIILKRCSNDAQKNKTLKIFNN